MKTQTCLASGKEFTIGNDELAFYQKMEVPVPKLSPIERLRERFAFRHGGKLHRVKCAGTGKSIISMVPEERGLKMFEQGYWWSDAWNGTDWGRSFDFSRPFFEQLKELYQAVPHLSMLNTSSENAYFTNHTLNSKDCYLLFGAVDNESVLYGYYIISCRDVLDGLSLHHCELCCDGVSSIRCYNCISFVDCQDCSDCILVHDCRSCSNCIACVGLQRKDYHILNRKVSKQEYEEFRKALKLGKYGALEDLEKQFIALKNNEARLAYHLYHCEDCTGDMTFNSKNCWYAFDCERCEDSTYLAFSQDSVGSYDCCYNGGGGAQFSYQSVSTLASDSRFNAVVWHSNDVDYSMECHHCAYLFGCVSLNRAQYCILNKQYSKEEYFELRDRIIEHMKQNGEWGRFFPGHLSPFRYNDSIANLYLPLEKSEAKKRGFCWQEEDLSTESEAEATLPPNSINDTKDDVVEKTFKCQSSGKLYKITPLELDLYRRLGIPIPRLAPEQRHRKRLTHRHHFELYERQCALSSETLLSPYDKELVPEVISPAQFIVA